jgi:hypothetical protein
LSRGMQLVAVRCQNCGASLKLEPEARYVTCKHCASQLEVRHTDGAAFTKVLEEVEDRLESTEKEIARLRLMHQLERLDREWDKEKEGFASYSEHGNKTYPSPIKAVFIVVIGVVVVGFILANGSLSGGMQGLVMLAAVIGIPVFAMMSHQEYRSFSAAEARYRSKRLELVAELNRVQAGISPEASVRPRFPLMKEKRRDPLA